MGNNVLIFEMAIREIVNLIIGNDMRQGDQLPPERELAKQLKISRTCIREALQFLASNYVVQIRRGKGAFVNIVDEAALGRFAARDASESDTLFAIKNIVEMRMLLETHAFQEVAKIITPEQLHTLYRTEATNYRALKNELAADPDSLKASMDFELLIFSFQPNAILTNFYSRLNDAWKSCMERVNLVALPLEVRHNDHLEIIMAIEGNSPKQIAKAVSNHLEGAYKAIEVLLRKK